MEKKDKMINIINNLTNFLVKYSMLYSLIIINLSIVSITYKSSNLYVIQFSVIILSIYLSIKIYEKYQMTILNKEYKILDKNKLEFIFIILYLFTIFISLLIDVNNIS